MTRINTNLSSLTAQHILGRSQASLQTSLTRLSTGLRINSGKDDPGGLIASEILRSEIVSIGQSISNSERANNIVATADAALGQVSTLLNDIRGRIQASANKGAISTAEIAANQVQVDSALESIARIGQTTVFGGDKLLNGTKAFSVSGSLGTAFQSTADINVSSFNPALHTSSAADDVSLAITQTATKKVTTVLGDDQVKGNGASLLDLSVGTSTRTTATLVTNDFTIGNGASLNDLSTGSTRATRTVSGTQGGAANDLLELTGTGTDTVTINVIGNLGTTAITVNVAAVQANSNALVTAVNAVSSTTGVIASSAGGAGANVTLTSSYVGTTAAATLTATAATQAGDVAIFNAAVSALTAGTNGAIGTKTTVFTITGSKGTATVSTDALSSGGFTGNDVIINNNPANDTGITALATLINSRTGTTGVTATVDASHNLVLTSSGVGSTSLADLTVGTAGADQTLLAAAGTKTVSTGVDGTSNSTTFELTGDLGRAVVTVNNDAVINNSLSLANAINAVSAQTGITATGSGHGANVVLTSNKYGSAAVVTLNAIAATNSADITLLNSANTQSSVAGLNATGTVTHSQGSGAFSAAGEQITYNDSSISFSATSAPTLAAPTRTTRTIVGNNGVTAGGLDSLSGATATDTITISVTGNTGTASTGALNVAALKADSRVLVDAINKISASTGVTASTTASGGSYALTDITLTSTTLGAAGTVSISATAATTGADATNFNLAGTLPAATQGYNAPSTALANFDVTGGALFQIGPTVNFANQINVNITALDLSTLGRNFSSTGNKGLSAIKTGGTDVLASADLSTAALLVTQAINEIATLRGKLGALQKNVLESNIASQQTTLEQVTAAESSIRDADFASETANLTRSQILVQAGTNVLAIANSSPQNVLALLQR